MMKRAFAIVVLAALVGCSSDRATRIETRRATENDTPFGGGFPPSQRPDGDPFGHAQMRNEIRPTYGADNGAPETRVGGNGDTRISNGDGRISR